MESPVVDRLLNLLSETEAEQGKVARMLHDDAGQVLSAIGLHLEVLRGGLTAEQSEQIVEIQQLLETVIARIRAVSRSLHVNLVERAGLGFALEQLACQGRERGSGMMIQLHIAQGERWPNEPAHAAYRIVGELLDNAMRHSAAQRIEIRLQGSTLEVRDDGRGFDAEKKTTGLGLLLCRHLAKRSRLGLAIQTKTGQGTIIKLTLHGS
jgi:signal transduction histidine kinase